MYKHLTPNKFNLHTAHVFCTLCVCVQFTSILHQTSSIYTRVLYIMRLCTIYKHLTPNRFNLHTCFVHYTSVYNVQASNIKQVHVIHVFCLLYICVQCTSILNQTSSIYTRVLYIMRLCTMYKHLKPNKFNLHTCFVHYASVYNVQASNIKQVHVIHVFCLLYICVQCTSILNQTSSIYTRVLYIMRLCTMYKHLKPNKFNLHTCFVHYASVYNVQASNIKQVHVIHVFCLLYICVQCTSILNQTSSIYTRVLYIMRLCTMYKHLKPNKFNLHTCFVHYASVYNVQASNIKQVHVIHVFCLLYICVQCTSILNQTSSIYTRVLYIMRLCTMYKHLTSNKFTSYTCFVHYTSVYNVQASYIKQVHVKHVF